MVAAALLPHLRRARDLVDQHYAEPLDLDALARVACVSKYYFARCFAETYAETPMRYLIRRRIERAQDLLRCANLTVTEVCMLIGFSSLGSFSFASWWASHPRATATDGRRRAGPAFLAASSSCVASTDGHQESNLGEALVPAGSLR